MRGLRIITVPEDFDADSSSQQEWMNNYIQTQVSTDLLFGVVFGKLTASDVKTFSNHGGPLGLKFAVLQVIGEYGLYHTPTFQEQVGSKGSPLREVIAMLTGAGLIMSPGFSVERVPTFKGRFLLDFARRLAFEKETAMTWSPELRLIMRHLQLDPPEIQRETTPSFGSGNVILDLLFSIGCSRDRCGVDIMHSITFDDPKFYSDFPFNYFTGENFSKISPEAWDDSDDIKRIGA